MTATAAAMVFKTFACLPHLARGLRHQHCVASCTYHTPVLCAVSDVTCANAACEVLACAVVRHA